VLDLLKGLRVVECGILLIGDVPCMLFGDLGADVIKIEEPRKGDYIRDMLGQIVPHHSPPHLQVNKNKRSVALNLNKDEGRAALFELVRTADIFVDGLRGGATDKMGVGYQALKKVKPDIIYLANCGFGHSGPYKRLASHGFSMNGVTGGLPLRRTQEGYLDSSRANETDLFGGIGNGGTGGTYAVAAALAAMLRRGRTGQGAFIDAAACDSMICGSWFAAALNLNFDRLASAEDLSPRDEPQVSPWPQGSTRYALYEDSAGRALMFAAVEQKFWDRFCDVTGRKELKATFRSHLRNDFGQDKPWLRQEIQSIFSRRTSEEWVVLGLEHDIPISPVNRLLEVPEDPHIRARGMIVDRDHPRAGTFTYTLYPAIVDGEHSDVTIPAPLLGEHTEEVLGALGYSKEQIRAACSV